MHGPGVKAAAMHVLVIGSSMQAGSTQKRAQGLGRIPITHVRYGAFHVVPVQKPMKDADAKATRATGWAHESVQIFTKPFKTTS